MEILPLPPLRHIAKPVMGDIYACIACTAHKRMATSILGWKLGLSLGEMIVQDARRPTPKLAIGLRVGIGANAVGRGEEGRRSSSISMVEEGRRIRAMGTGTRCMVGDADHIESCGAS